MKFPRMLKDHLCLIFCKWNKSSKEAFQYLSRVFRAEEGGEASFLQCGPGPFRSSGLAFCGQLCSSIYSGWPSWCCLQPVVSPHNAFSMWHEHRPTQKPSISFLSLSSSVTFSQVLCMHVFSFLHAWQWWMGAPNLGTPHKAYGFPADTVHLTC